MTKVDIADVSRVAPLDSKNADIPKDVQMSQVLPDKMASSAFQPDLNAKVSTNDDGKQNFRFFDNRQKYLLFVNTCSEKRVVANRVSMEIPHIHPTAAGGPQPPPF
jgi:hypothetical protein